MENFVVVFFIFGVWFKGYDCQDSVFIQPSSVAKADEGNSLTLTCTYTGTNSPVTVIWNINNVATDMSVLITSCTVIGTPASDYEVSRYSFTCSNPYSLKITQTTLADDGDSWGCTVGFTGGIASPSVSRTSISINKKVPSYLLLLLILLILLPISILVILICCGCLDCCQCCRIFDHYDKKKWCYVTWHCLKKGCCSFFYCRPGNKRGKCFCGHKFKNGCCGGCNSCRMKCACGWPELCKSENMKSCGCCFCICCVQGLKDDDLDAEVTIDMENRSVINGTPTNRTGTQNKVESSTMLPPILAKRQPTAEVNTDKEKPKKKKMTGESD